MLPWSQRRASVPRPAERTEIPPVDGTADGMASRRRAGDSLDNLYEWWCRAPNGATPQAPERSVSSVRAALYAPAVTSQDAKPEPHECSDEGGDEDEQPDRPGELPRQELDRDVLGVLDHEDGQRTHAGDGRDRTTAELQALSSIRVRACVVVTGRLVHEFLLVVLRRPSPDTSGYWHAMVRRRCCSGSMRWSWSSRSISRLHHPRQPDRHFERHAGHD